ncbi:MAG TPA: hypothetical protein VMT81_01455 [Candidatus Paceibacterota bacterium]|nr:hypothetical protein [Candidatus Paceibacterota bacterium]
MKKITTYLVIAASLAYYAALPFVVAHAVDLPGPVGATTPAFAGDPTSTVSQVLYMRVTAYASVPDETDDTPFITANGTRVHDGIVASNILPFGTQIQIPAIFGDKIFTVEDRMSTRIKNTIDLWMPTVSAAIRFGAERANIVVLSPVSSTRNLAIE